MSELTGEFYGGEQASNLRSVAAGEIQGRPMIY
jgi:hypothetical protein